MNTVHKKIMQANIRSSGNREPTSSQWNVVSSFGDNWGWRGITRGVTVSQARRYQSERLRANNRQSHPENERNMRHSSLDRGEWRVNNCFENKSTLVCVLWYLWLIPIYQSTRICIQESLSVYKWTSHAYRHIPHFTETQVNSWVVTKINLWEPSVICDKWRYILLVPLSTRQNSL